MEEIKLAFRNEDDFNSFKDLYEKLLKTQEKIEELVPHKDIGGTLVACLFQQYWQKLLETTDSEGFFSVCNLYSKNTNAKINRSLQKCKNLRLIEYKQKNDTDCWWKIDEKSLVSKLSVEKEKLDTCLKTIEEVAENLYSIVGLNKNKKG